jgi:pimeloyl-ACP methyl ester carboxylesterase
LPDGRRLGYAEHGDPVGMPLIYVHGWPGSRFQGLRLDVAARARGVRVIAPERPGYGLSEAQPGRGLLDWPRDVVALADALGIGRFAVCGASGGGPFALACAVAIPERLTGVAIANGLAPFDAPGVLVGYRRSRRLAAQALVLVPGALRLCLSIVAWRARRDPRAFLAGAARRLPPVDRAIVSQPVPRAIAVQDILAALHDGGRAAAREARLLSRAWSFRVEDIGMPIQLWYGGADTLVAPAMGHYLASAIRRSEPHYLPDEGHYLMIPRAGEILGALVGCA